MVLKVEVDREEDGRWIADIPEIPGVMVYSATRKEALAKVQRLALAVLAEEMEERQEPTGFLTVSFVAAQASGPRPRPSESWTPCLGRGGRFTANVGATRP